MGYDKRAFVHLREVAFLSQKLGVGLDIHVECRGESCCNTNVLGFLQRRELDDLLFVLGPEYHLLSIF